MRFRKQVFPLLSNVLHYRSLDFLSPLCALPVSFSPYHFSIFFLFVSLTSLFLFVSSFPLFVSLFLYFLSVSFLISSLALVFFSPRAFSLSIFIVSASHLFLFDAFVFSFCLTFPVTLSFLCLSSLLFFFL